MATILLVEDEMLLADCYMRWLGSAGHTVHHASDAYAAIDTVDDTPPQAILLDLLLPGANGLQLLHTLRSHADLQLIPIILCSNALPAKLPDLSAYGVKKVIEKTTLDRKKLCAAIAEVLS